MGQVKLPNDPSPTKFQNSLIFELLIYRVIDIFFGNVKIDQEKENFNKDFGIKGEEPF